MSIKHFCNAFCTECDQDTLHYKTLCRTCGNPLITNKDAYRAASEHINAKTAILSGRRNVRPVSYVARGKKLRDNLRAARVQQRLDDRATAIWRQLDRDAANQRYGSKAGIFGKRPWK